MIPLPLPLQYTQEIKGDNYHQKTVKIVLIHKKDLHLLFLEEEE